MCKKLQALIKTVEENKARNIKLVGAFLRITKTVKAALFLSQVYYWSQHLNGDKWFYKTCEEWEQELGLSPSEQRTIRKELREIVVIDEKVMGMARKNYFRLNAKKVMELLANTSCENSVTEIPNDKECASLTTEVNELNDKPSTNLSIDVKEVNAKSSGNLTPSGQETSPPIRTPMTTLMTTHMNTPMTTPNARACDNVVDKETVCSVFDHWKKIMNHPKAKLDDKRRKLICQALKSGYSESDLCQAIDGCAVTPCNQGQNERGQRYDGLHIILRDAEQIDRFMENATNPPRAKNKSEMRESQNMQVVNDFMAQLDSGAIVI